MKYLFLIATTILFAGLLTGCTDAFVGKLESYGDSARVTCYSGTKLIFDDCSTGKIASEANSDGYFFRSKATGRNVEVAGNCVIAYNQECPEKAITLPVP